MPKADTPPGFKPLKETPLFSPFKLGPLNLEHRIVQAPLTRMRAVKEDDGVFVPKDLHVEYYSQRASKGGLQLTEATDIAKYVSPLLYLTPAIMLTCLGQRIPWCTWSLFGIANCGLEEGHRCSARKGWLHLLPAMAHRPCEPPVISCRSADCELK